MLKKESLILNTKIIRLSYKDGYQILDKQGFIMDYFIKANKNIKVENVNPPHRELYISNLEGAIYSLMLAYQVSAFNIRESFNKGVEELSKYTDTLFKTLDINTFLIPCIFMEILVQEDDIINYLYSSLIKNNKLNFIISTPDIVEEDGYCYSVVFETVKRTDINKKVISIKFEIVKKIEANAKDIVSTLREMTNYIDNGDYLKLINKWL